MALYAAYGSNMDPAQMLRRCPSSPHTGTGWIRGWRLTFGAEEYGWEGALATIVPDGSPEQLHPGVRSAVPDLEKAVLSGELTPALAAQQILQTFLAAPEDAPAISP